MTKMDCDRCKKTVQEPVRIEEASGLCVTCIPSVAAECKSLKEKNRQLDEAFWSCQKACKTHIETIERMHCLNDAERLGRAASNKGVGTDENPYPDDAEEHVVWASGWEHENVLNEFARNMAVFRWVAESLEIIRDIAQEEEVHAKLDTVINKLSEVVAG